MSTTGVNKERVRLLVDALRSGEYRQARGELIETDVEFDGMYYVPTGPERFCCLGVACKIAIEADPELAKLVTLESIDPGNVEREFRVRVYDDASEPFQVAGSTLPSVVRDWYGFDNNDPTIGGDDDYTQASNMPLRATEANDDLTWNFDQIANGFEMKYLA